VLAARLVQFHPRPQVVSWAIRRERRSGYSALIHRLRQRSPRLLLLARAVAAATLFEVWMHHDDLTAANGLAHGTPDHLAEAIPWLVRYQASRLPTARLIVRTTDNREWAFGPNAGPSAVLTGPDADLVRWLAGRRPLSALNIAAEAAVTDQLRAFAGEI
jgi:uncharacterized protein (TIGR03083 family)